MARPDTTACTAWAIGISMTNLGAIAVLHELAGEINAFIEKNAVEREKQPELIAGVSAAAQTLRNLGGVLGLFKQGPLKPEKTDNSLPDQLMKLIIQLRQQARADKNFGIADSVRKGLAEIGITLEDRPDGTIWRKE